MSLIVICSVAVFTAALCPVVTDVLERARVVDGQNGRSSHVGEVPRGGGLALLGGILGCTALAAGQADEQWTLVAAILTVAALATLGFVDDLVDLDPTMRLVAQIVVSALFALSLPFSDPLPDWMGVALVTLLLVGYVNSFNFMDGINGISAITSIVAASSLAIASYRWGLGLHVPASAVIGAALGFAPFNVSKRLFLGDIGSYLLGASLATLGIVAVAGGAPPVMVGLPFGLYIGDVGYTLVRRVARGDSPLQSHREHVYQRLANEAGWGHDRTALVVGLFTVLLAVVAHVLAGSPTGDAVAIVAGAVIVALYLALPTMVRVSSTSRAAPRPPISRRSPITD